MNFILSYFTILSMACRLCKEALHLGFSLGAFFSLLPLKDAKVLRNDEMKVLERFFWKSICGFKDLVSLGAKDKVEPLRFKGDSLMGVDVTICEAERCGVDVCKSFLRNKSLSSSVILLGS